MKQPYRLIKDVTPPYTNIRNRVGIYIDTNCSKRIIKKSKYFFGNSDTLFLKNEASILRILSANKALPKIYPRFVDLVEQKNQVSLVTEFAEGKKIEEFKRPLRKFLLHKTYDHLLTLNKQLKKHHFHGFKKRSPIYFLLGFPFYLIRVILKNPKKLIYWLKTGFKFYFNYGIGIMKESEVELAHRDLWPDNILYSQKNRRLTILDWESAVVTDSLYDLSQIAMIYSREWGNKSMLEFIRNHLETNAQRRRFIGLSIYNAILLLSQNDSKVSANINKFLGILFTQFSPAIIYQKTPFEIVNGFILDMIGNFYKITGKPINDRNKKIVLCYHSIGNDGWRFSTRIRMFESHSRFLRSHYKLKPLHKLLSENEGGATISFDDGYENLITNALPIIEKTKTSPTVFVLGDPKRANRDELDNSLPLLRPSQIKQLRKKNWEIGYHTKTHPNLSRLNDSELNNEIVEGKKELGKKLGMTLKYFAYPKGFYSKKVKKYVKRARFTSAFTVDGRDIDTRSKDELLIDRIPVEGELTTKQLAALLSPIGLYVTRILMKLLVLKERYLKIKLKK